MSRFHKSIENQEIELIVYFQVFRELMKSIQAVEGRPPSPTPLPSQPPRSRTRDPNEKCALLWHQQDRDKSPVSQSSKEQNHFREDSKSNNSSQLRGQTNFKFFTKQPPWMFHKTHEYYFFAMPKYRLLVIHTVVKRLGTQTIPLNKCKKKVKVAK